MPLIVDKYILLIAKKRKKSTKTKHTNKQKKNMYTVAYQRRVNGGKSPERREQTI